MYMARLRNRVVIRLVGAVIIGLCLFIALSCYKGHRKDNISILHQMIDRDNIVDGVLSKRPSDRAPRNQMDSQTSQNNSKVIPHVLAEEDQFMQRMSVVQNQRHALIRQKCNEVYKLHKVDFFKDREKIMSWKHLYEHAYANDDFKFIICRVLKVGSLSWRNIINSLYMKGSLAFRKSQKTGDVPIMNYDDDRFYFTLRNYTKVLFVREPFARLLSGYRDKYVELRHFPYYRPIGRNIIKTYRKGATKAELATGKPTFEEFLRWVIQEDTADHAGDFHWRPLSEWYHPCQMEYDYIGKLETVNDDSRYVFKMLGIDKLETYPSTESHHPFSSNQMILKKFYSQLPDELLPKIIERYKEEFILFDYPIPQQFSDIWTVNEPN